MEGCVEAVALRFVAPCDPAALLLVLFYDRGSDARSFLAVGRKLLPGAPIANVCGNYDHDITGRHHSETRDQPTELEAKVCAVMTDAVSAAIKRALQLMETVPMGRRGGADALPALVCRYSALLSAATHCGEKRR